MAGPPYAVAPNFRKPNTMSFQCFLKFSPCINHLGLTVCEARALGAQAALTFWRSDYRGANSVFFDRGNSSSRESHSARLLSGEAASLSRCLYPNRCRINNVRHRRFRIRCNTADVNFAKHIGIFAVFVLWTEQKVAIPENWKILGLNLKQLLRCRYPLIL